MKKPNFFIVGAPKCGTTALYEYLKVHPDIFMPETLKEPHYFGSEVNYVDEENYFSLFKNWKDEKMAGEASAGYLASEDAAKQIKIFNPDAKIIIMLRNPVDVMYSFHSQLCFSREETINNFEEAMKEDLIRTKEYINSDKDSKLFLLRYREIAKFTKQIERYFNEFGREKIHIIIHDDFKKNNAEEYKKVLEFLEVDDSFSPEFKVHNPNTTSRIPFLMQTIYMSPKWLRKIFRFVFPSFSIRHKIKYFVIKLNTAKANRNKMNPELRKKLQEEFSEEVENLSKLLNRDLTHWNK